jgi:hypothetical protein
MLDKLREATKKAEKNFKKTKINLSVKGLIDQLSNDICNYQKQGDWEFAVRLAYYRHEFAKNYQFLDWYRPYLEIRKIRDTILILISSND